MNDSANITQHWHAKLKKTCVDVDENFLENASSWWRGKQPFVIQSHDRDEMLRRAKQVAEHSGMRVIVIDCAEPLQYRELFGDERGMKPYPGRLGQIISENYDTCLIFDAAENFPNNPDLIEALIMLCDRRRIKLNGQYFENSAIRVNAIFTTTDINRLGFLIESWIDSRRDGN